MQDQKNGYISELEKTNIELKSEKEIRLQTEQQLKGLNDKFNRLAEQLNLEMEENQKSSAAARGRKAQTSGSKSEVYRI